MCVKRISVSIPGKTAKRFERTMKAMGYGSRSKAVADALELFLQKNQGRREGNAGSITLGYDAHPAGGLEKKLTEIQHSHYRIIAANFHVHMRSSCMEIIAVKGNLNEIRALTNKIARTKGIRCCELTLFQF